jgi:hypothetical protein
MFAEGNKYENLVSSQHSRWSIEPATPFHNPRTDLLVYWQRRTSNAVLLTTGETPGPVPLTSCWHVWYFKPTHLFDAGQTEPMDARNVILLVCIGIEVGASTLSSMLVNWIAPKLFKQFISNTISAGWLTLCVKDRIWNLSPRTPEQMYVPAPYYRPLTPDGHVIM